MFLINTLKTNKFKKIIWLGVIFCLIFSIFYGFSILAQGPGGSGPGETGGPGPGGPGGPGPGDSVSKSFTVELKNPLKAESFTELISGLLSAIFTIAIPIAVIMIIISGVMFLTSSGNPDRIQTAKNILKWALIGLVIILIGRGFITLIRSILDLGT